MIRDRINPGNDIAPSAAVRDRTLQFTPAFSQGIDCLAGGILLGRSGTGAGLSEEISLGDGLALANGVLTASGGGVATVVSLTEPTEKTADMLWTDSTDGSLNQWDAVQEVWVNLSHEVEAGAFTVAIQKLALSGDSHVRSATKLGGVVYLHSAFEAYAPDKFSIVSPSNRDTFTHGIGGATVLTFLDNPAVTGQPTQAEELFTLLENGDIDTALVSFGSNDMVTAPDDMDAHIARLKDEFVVPFVADGGAVVVMCVPPCRNIPAGDSDYNLQIEHSILWNAAIKTEFLGMTNVLVYDASGLFGEVGNRQYITDFWLSDSVHLPPMAQVHEGIEMISILTPFSAGAFAEEAWEWVNSNPYLKTALPAQMQAVSQANNTAPTVEYIAKVGGETDERIAKISFDKTVSVMSSGGNGVRYDLTVAASGKSVHVNQLTAVTGVPLSVSAFRYGTNYILINVQLATGTTNDAVIALVNADAEASEWVTASLVGTGSVAAVIGTGGGIQVRSNAYNTADAVTVNNGDIVRAYCEIEPEPGEEGLFNLGIINPNLFGSSPGYSYLSYAHYQTWIPQTPYPIEAGQKLVFASPWTTITGGNTQLINQLQITGTGKFRISRTGVQRKIVP